MILFNKKMQQDFFLQKFFFFYWYFIIIQILIEKKDVLKAPKEGSMKVSTWQESPMQGSAYRR